MSNFQPLEAVNRGSDPQLRVVETFNNILSRRVNTFRLLFIESMFFLFSDPALPVVDDSGSAGVLCSILTVAVSLMLSTIFYS